RGGSTSGSRPTSSMIRSGSTTRIAEWARCSANPAWRSSSSSASRWQSRRVTLQAEETRAPGPPGRPAFQRVLLKLSGEALLGDRDHGVDERRIESLAEEIVGVHSTGLQIAIVIGAGNLIRGMEAAAAGMDRATADYAGMLATLLNSLTVQDALERHGAQTRVQSAITVAEAAEPYIRRPASPHPREGAVPLFPG